MIEPQRVGMEATQRVKCLDFLRGFFVFLALWQHFAYYINYWFVRYYGGWSFWGDYFESQVQNVGVQIPADEVSTWAAWFFTPWVSQIYLFLAAFNLAKRDHLELREKVSKKVLIFFSLFFVFSFENMLVAPNIGEAFSLYPLQTWMLILGVILGVYAWIGTKGVWLIFSIGLLKFLIPLDVAYEAIENVVRSNLHENFEIDARPDYFMSSAALGFLVGRSWWQQKYHELLRWGIVGLCAFIIWWIFGESFTVISEDVFATEHDLAKTLIGSIGIYGIELLVISFTLGLKIKGIDLDIGIFNWIGRFSFLVFLFHRIIFVKLILPVRMIIAETFDHPLNGSFVELWLYVLLIVLFAWMIKKTRILTALEGG